MKRALYIEKHYKSFNRHYCVIQLLLTLKVVIFVKLYMLLTLLPLWKAIWKWLYRQVTDHKKLKIKKNKKLIGLLSHFTFDENVIFNMLSNSSQQTGCQISLDKANSRNESAPRDKTFEVLERGITWTLKAVPRQSVLESLE